MFDFLKKKISGLVDKIAGKNEPPQPEQPKKEVRVEEPVVAEKKIEAETARKPVFENFERKEEKALEKPQPSEIAKPPEKPARPAEHKKAEAAAPTEKAKPAPVHMQEAKVEAKTEPAPEKVETKQHEPQRRAHAEMPVRQETATYRAPKAHEKKVTKEIPKTEERLAAPKPEPVPQEVEHKPAQKEAPAVQKAPDAAKAAVPIQPEAKKEKEDGKIKIGLVKHITSMFTNEVELGEREVGEALGDFELELLETDVAFEVAEQIKEELRKELVGKTVKKSELQQHISSVFLKAIRDIMAENRGKTIAEYVSEASTKPMKIMFTGPNGSGKTTTIAKIAKMLKESGYGVVIAAADTFRAAAIEQMEIHGNKLGVKVIKGKYGADPTSVAFDAVNHAKAHGLDVVLIDTAGRQETNQNLLNELKKMARVINPELKIYVGESIAGNAIIEQVAAFNRELKLDGVILTKLDCDAKGGTVISISKVTRVPVLYITTGQGYDDFEVFDPDKMAKSIAG